MLIYTLLGITYGFAAAIQPGPLSTYLISRTLQTGWRYTLPATLAPLLSDGPIVALVMTVLSQVPARLEQGLRFAGGFFLAYLAAGAVKAWRCYDPRGLPPPQAGRESALRAAMVNLLNPNPYLAWSLVLGPLLLKAWREAPAHGIMLVASFYGTMIATLVAVVLLFHAARKVGPQVNRVLIGLSAIGLACLAAYQLWLGLRSLLGPLLL